jgi:serine/threonine-protein kinase
MIGQTLGHYRILEKVGAGGMGVVYRAHDEQLERDVALKVLHYGTLSDDTARRHFRKEALALAKLNHPNIGTVYEFGTQDGIDFLVMEYVPGKTLADQLVGRTLAEKDVIALGIQIASALEEAHERGIVHRDLKPANIAITAKGSAKVLDFGLAKLLNPMDEGPTEVWTESQAGAGTLPYMSPEQLKGERVDARADIYTIGTVLYEMATGCRAFRDSAITRLIDAILHQQPVSTRSLNAGISPELDAIILKCLDKDRDLRYQSAKELLVDLHRLQPSSSGITALPIPSPIGNARRKRIAYAVVALLVLAASLTAMNARGWRDRLFGRTRAPQIHSLAVLPFENLSGDPAQDYFADGMTEALITDLGQLRALRVISRTSVMRYKSSQKPLDQIAQELQVDAVVEGSVSRSDGLARVTARLVYCPTDAQLWSKTYQRDLQNLLVLQADVASAIVNEIHLTLTPTQQAQLARGRAVNPVAHEAYLKGRYHWNKGGPQERKMAKEYFEQALSVDPNYAPAYAGLADYFWATSDLPPQDSIPKARQYVLKALQLDNTLAHAHASLGAIRFFGDWDWALAEKEFKTALELNPNDAEAHQMYSAYLASLERFDEALWQVQRAQELDPFSLLTGVSLGWTLYFARRYDQAIEECQKALELDQNSAGAHDCLGQSYRIQGKYDQAIAETRLAASLSAGDPARDAGLACAYAAAGMTNNAQTLLRDLRLRAKTTYLSRYLLASVSSCIDQPDDAFAALEQAYGMRDPDLTSLKVDPVFDHLSSDPRFKNLLQRVGLPQ